MRDTNSHILIPGFYDDVRALTAAERQAIAQSPDVDTPLKQETWPGMDRERRRLIADGYHAAGVEYSRH